MLSGRLSFPSSLAIPALLCVASSTLFLGRVAEAAEIRLSVKFILDSNGNRATGSEARLNTNSEVEMQVNWGNLALCRSGSDFRIRLDEIVDISGYGTFFNFDCGGLPKETMEAVFKLTPGQSCWRSNKVNVYIVGNSCAGSSSMPGEGEIIVLGQSSFGPALLHELGHFFGLYHTHGDCGDCVPCTDFISDTILDGACWETKDRMASENYGLAYVCLSAAKRKLVDQTFGNIMSYHDPWQCWVLTPQQNDAMMKTALLDRFEVVNWDHEPDSECPQLKFPAPKQDDGESFGGTEGVDGAFAEKTPDDEADSSRAFDARGDDPPVFIRGDANSDGRVGFEDAAALIEYLFDVTDRIKCDDAADANDDGVLDAEDAMLLLAVAFGENATLGDSPLGEPTVDRTADELGCTDTP